MIEPKSYGSERGKCVLSKAYRALPGNVADIDGDVVVAIGALVLVGEAEHVPQLMQDRADDSLAATRARG